MSKEIVVFGSIVQDLVSYVERFPKPGESVRGKQFKLWCGGKGANQAVAAAKLGAKVTMIGRVGTDMFGDANINAMKDAGVDTSCIEKSPTASTATGSICVSADGENCIVVTLGANLELSAERAQQLESKIAGAQLLLTQSEVPQDANHEAMQIAKKHNVTTFFNPAPGRKDLDRRLVGLSDVICTNENEAEFITELSLSSLDEFKEAAKKMLELGPRIAIVTMGPKGAIIAQRKESGVTVDTVEAPKVTAVDTTGAGDSFCGSLAYFLAEEPHGDVVRQVEKAVKIAAVSVQRHGPQASYPSAEELRQMGIL
ncbi:Protein F07A11.5 [Aphelenchoides avenae]|nr:Protein F07A11.5 [Aphelenchus avenae]